MTSLLLYLCMYEHIKLENGNKHLLVKVTILIINLLPTYFYIIYFKCNHHSHSAGTNIS